MTFDEFETNEQLREQLALMIEAASVDPKVEAGGILWFTPEGSYLADAWANVAADPEGRFKYTPGLELKRRLAGYKPAAYWHSHPEHEGFYFSQLDEMLIKVSTTPWILIQPNNYDCIIYESGKWQEFAENSPHGIIGREIWLHLTPRAGAYSATEPPKN